MLFPILGLVGFAGVVISAALLIVMILKGKTLLIPGILFLVSALLVVAACFMIIREDKEPADKSTGDQSTVDQSNPDKSKEDKPDKSEDTSNEKLPSSSQEENANSDKTYQSILDEYTEKLRNAAPLLVEEYNTEATQNQGGLEGLATLSNEKIGELAKISNEGIQEMAQVMMKTGSGKYDEYEEWAGKLQEVYMEEAQKITEAYMDSAIG